MKLISKLRDAAQAVRARLIDDLKSCWKLLSVQLHLAAVAIAGIYELMPVLDPTIAAMLPAPQQAKAIGAYALGGLIVRLIKQKSAQ